MVVYIYTKSYLKRTVKMINRNFTIKALSALLLAGTMLFATSCAENVAPDGYLIAEPDGKDYTYSYPDSWSVIRSDSMFAIQSSDRNANISSSCYAVELLAEGETVPEGTENPYAYALEKYVNRDVTGYVSMLKDNFGEKVEIISAEATSVDQKAGYKLLYKLKIGEDEYHFATVLAVLPTIGSTYLYDITYTTLGKENFDVHMPVFEGVVASFDFR